MGALRSLAIGQQIGLLFVALFGLLLGATAWTVWRSLHAGNQATDARQRALHERIGRDLRALWIGALLFWISWVSGPAGSTLLFGLLSFLVLREYVTLTDTRRGDHRSLLLAFFVVLPLQYVLVAWRAFDAFTVFIPVYVFFAIPVLSALANDPLRFLERTAKIQWGVTVCVYGLSHTPALLLLDGPDWHERGAFLVFFLVMVVAAAQIAREVAARRLRARPVARAISRGFTWPAFGCGVGAAALLGVLLYWITPFKPLAALASGAIAGAAALLGAFVIEALKRDAGVVARDPAWRVVAASRRSEEPAVQVTGVQITGAVGLLDRVAPLCFAAPVFFHAVRWYFSSH